MSNGKWVRVGVLPNSAMKTIGCVEDLTNLTFSPIAPTTGWEGTLVNWSVVVQIHIYILSKKVRYWNYKGIVPSNSYSV